MSETTVTGGREIVVRLTTIDHFSKRGKFKTLEGARKFAHRYVGPHPDISTTFGYAVGVYGDAKITWEGCTAAELFPEPEAPKAGHPNDDYYDDGPRRGHDEGCAYGYGGDCTCGYFKPVPEGP